MGKDIEIGIASETKAFKQGVEAGIIDPVEDAVDALDKLGKSRGPEQLEDSMRDAQKASERLEDEVQQTARSIEQDFKQAYKSVGDDAKTGMTRAGEVTRGFKEEALANFSEVSSSFDGTLQGIADGVQGTFGGAALAIGGAAGVALGVVGAVGGAVLQAAASEAERVKEVVNDAFDDMVENSQRVVSNAFQLEQVQTILADETKLAYIGKWAGMLKDFGVGVEDITLAIAGNADAQDRVNDAIEGYSAKLDSSTPKSAGAATQQQLFRTELENLRGELGLVNGAVDTAATKYDIYSAAAADLATKSTTATDAVYGTKSAVEALPDSKNIAVTTSGIPEAEAALEGLGRARTVRVTVEGVTRSGEKVF